MKAIGIARVSTKEQEEQGFSIPAQVARIQEYAQKYGYTEVEIYTIYGELMVQSGKYMKIAGKKVGF